MAFAFLDRKFGFSFGKGTVCSCITARHFYECDILTFKNDSSWTKSATKNSKMLLFPILLRAALAWRDMGRTKKREEGERKPIFNIPKRREGGRKGLLLLCIFDFFALCFVFSHGPRRNNLYATSSGKRTQLRAASA